MKTEFPPFYIGQRVVCIEKDAKGRTNVTLKEEIFLNEEYTVVKCAYYKGFHLEYWYITVNQMQTMWHVKSFTPIEENFISISLEKVLEKETELIGAS